MPPIMPPTTAPMENAIPVWPFILYDSCQKAPDGLYVPEAALSALYPRRDLQKG